MPKEYGTPGPRAIYPDMCTSRSIASCSLAAQLLFDRLLVQCDDQGRIEGDALVIKSLCVPLVDVIPARAIGRGARRMPGIDDLLAELESEDLVYRYQNGRSTLIQLVTWWRWQQGMRRAYPSRWPGPDDWTDAVYGLAANMAPSYKVWVSAALRGSAPHNAAWRGMAPQSAALTRAGLPAAPAAPALSGALSGALSDTPPPPAERGRREDGTNPRADGTNPRATGEDARSNGESPRQEREAAKRAPVMPLQVAEPDDGLTEEEIQAGVAEYHERMRKAGITR